MIRPVAIALDRGRGRIYWTDSGSNKIQRANLDGSRLETLVSIGLHSPEGLALDVDGGKVYWSDYGTNKIQRANLDGSQVEDLITTGLRIPGELALDVGAGKIYWTDYGTDKIQRADLDGSNIEDLITTELTIAKGLDLDISAGKIYWTDSGTRKIQRANLDGSNVEDLITRPSDTPTGLALANPVAYLSPSPTAVALPRAGTWRRFEVQASEPVLVVANPTASPARILVAQSREAVSECPAEAEYSITRYDGQDVYLAACEPGSGHGGVAQGLGSIGPTDLCLENTRQDKDVLDGRGQPGQDPTGRHRRLQRRRPGYKRTERSYRYCLGSDWRQDVLGRIKARTKSNEPISTGRMSKTSSRPALVIP